MGFQVEISHLNYGVRGREILRNIDLRIEPGSFAAILGENGAGKTTLLDLIMGFREPSNGMLKVDEEEPYLDHWMKRQDIAYLSARSFFPIVLIVLILRSFLVEPLKEKKKNQNP